MSPYKDEAKNTIKKLLQNGQVKMLQLTKATGWSRDAIHGILQELGAKPKGDAGDKEYYL